MKANWFLVMSFTYYDYHTRTFAGRNQHSNESTIQIGNRITIIVVPRFKAPKDTDWVCLVKGSVLSKHLNFLKIKICTCTSFEKESQFL